MASNTSLLQAPWVAVVGVEEVAVAAVVALRLQRVHNLLQAVYSFLFWTANR
jgi:hypothetical protein